MDKYDLLVIGGGAAGMAAALTAAQDGRRVLLAERSGRLGGVLPQCLHQGFGLSYFHQDLTGAAYAERFIRRLAAAPVEVRLGTMVVELTAERTAWLSSEAGFWQVGFAQAILASGCREIPLGALPIAGTRPSGIFTAGQAQQMVNLYGYDIGDEVVILGSGDIGLIMAQQLSRLGKQVRAIIEQKDHLGGLPEHQERCQRGWRIPVITSATIGEIHGQQRLSGVTVCHKDGRRDYLPCSTLIVAVGLLPERELAAPLAIDGGYPDWLALCGNCDYVHKIVDTVTIQAEKTAAALKPAK